jgi:short-subunit dehydrogenase
MAHTVAITGASSGIGRALAMEYAAAGTTLGLLGRNATRLEAVAASCRARGAVVETGTLDIRDTATVIAWLQAFDAHHPVNLLIANAGVLSGTGAGNRPESADDALRVIDINLKGAVATVSALIQCMRARQAGQIALVSSLAGLAPQPDLPAYSASKAALVSYGTALRIGLRGSGVSVSVVCPGYVESPMLERQKGEKPFTWPADKAARHIHRGLDRRRRLIAFPWQLAVGIRLLPLVPGFLQDRILGGFRAEIAAGDDG